MEKMKILILSSLTLMVAFFGISLVEIDSESRFEYEQNDSVQVCILTVDDTTEEIAYTSYAEDFQSANLVIIDQSWMVSQNESDLIKTIDRVLEANTPLVITGQNDIVLSHLEKSLPFSLSVDSYSGLGLYVDDSGYISQHIWVGDSDEIAIDDAKEWQAQAINKAVCAVPGSNSLKQTYWVPLGHYSVGMSLGDRGSFDVSYEISLLQNNPDKENRYFTIHYIQNGAPNVGNNYRLADLRLEYSAANAEIDLLESEPTSTSGTSTNSFNLEFSAEATLAAPPEVSVSVGPSLTWEYSASDVIVSNQSNHYENRCYIWHDINEERNPDFDSSFR